MALIRRREPEEETLVPPLFERWQPFRLLRDMFRWEPFRELERGLLPPRWVGFSPDVEVRETKDAYVFQVDLPGVKEEELDISVTGNRLSISGKRETEKREEGETYYCTECAYGSFTRSFTLPDGVNADDATAKLEAGVLTITVPKSPEVQAKKIEIGGAKTKPAKA
jgi:HSP20 family protein